MKIAITAASGSLSRAIIKELEKRGHNSSIIGLARTPEKASDLGIEIRKGDYNQQGDLFESLKGVDTVLLVSGMDLPDKRIIQHQNVIHAAKKAGVKKIVYTSIIGKPGNSTFDAIVNSNRQTEKDIQSSGMQWAIGRNGLYIEPDIEYIDSYKKYGKIANCAGDGLCSYTTRAELAAAYAEMLLNPEKNGRIYNLAGDAITQMQLTSYLNKSFGLNLKYEKLSIDEYLDFQQKVNGEFLGSVIAGIYTKIRQGEFNIVSDFEAAANRKHISWDTYFKQISI